jgi:hypothetical protein
MSQAEPPERKKPRRAVVINLVPFAIGLLLLVSGIYTARVGILALGEGDPFGTLLVPSFGGVMILLGLGLVCFALETRPRA